MLKSAKKIEHATFTAAIKKNGRHYIGWIEEVPGANTQGGSVKEVRENLKEALALIIESNRMISKQEKESLPSDSFFTERLTIQLA